MKEAEALRLSKSVSKNQVISGLFWRTAERVSAQAVNFVVSIVLARLLVPEDYGVIALITVFIALCDVIVNGGLTTALIQKKNADNVDFSTIFFFYLMFLIFV